MDWTWPNVCTSANLAVSEDRRLQLNPRSGMQLVADVVVPANGDGKVAFTPDIAQPKVLIEHKMAWSNDLGLDVVLRVCVTRGSRSVKTSQPNAIQFRDRYTWAVNAEPSEPSLTGYYNSQCGAGIDLGTNSTAEPNPGRLWVWWDAHLEDEFYDVDAGEDFKLWYRCAVWTPEPWSDNANSGNPEHTAAGRFTRLQLIAYPKQDGLVVG